jgi:membrane protease subunit HflK
MAWNEPGGSGNKDPWGDRKGGNQPPDLDEVIKKFQDKLGAIFGGGSGGSGSGGGKAGSLGVGLIAAVLVAVWFFSGFYIVDEGKRGVVLQFGAYNKTTLPGLSWYPPFIQTVDIVDIENIRSVSIGFRPTGNNRTGSTRVVRESLMLTKDENIVDVQLAVQYKVKSASDFLFNVKEPETTLVQATESAIREIIGKNKMDFILREGRAEITARARTEIQNILDLYKTGLQVTKVNMKDAQPPEQVQDAFSDVVKAREDSVRLKNEAEAYANDIIPKARGKAARQLAEAEAYKEQVIARATGEAARFSQVLTEYEKAPTVTRKRLYLESVESVMSNSSKVMIDVDGGGNIMYLPLDRMMGNTNTSDKSSARRLIEGIGQSRSKDQQDVRDSQRGRGVR